MMAGLPDERVHMNAQRRGLLHCLSFFLASYCRFPASVLVKRAASSQEDRTRIAPPRDPGGSATSVDAYRSVRSVGEYPRFVDAEHLHWRM